MLKPTSIASLKVIAIALVVAVSAGCVSAKGGWSGSAGSGSSSASTSTSSSGGIGAWVVAAGQHLWGIAAESQVFSNPEQWPLLYRQNASQIKDPDLIFPGQKLTVPRNLSNSDINAAIQHARTRGAWAVGEIEASDQQYLNNN